MADTGGPSDKRKPLLFSLYYEGTLIWVTFFDNPRYVKKD